MTMFEDERATKAALAYLRDTKIDCIVTITPPPLEEGEGEEGG